MGRRYNRTKPYKIEPTTLCWCCANAINDGCSWSKNFIPVEGWRAIPTIIIEGAGRKKHSFKVIECPKFIQDVEPRYLGLPRNQRRDNT